MKLYERFADKDFHTSIATSFGIDFDAYENIVLPRLRGAGCRNNIVVSDSRMLTHALGGASILPRHAGKNYTVNGAGAAGVFHPKLFLQVGRRRGRLIVSSANLTSSGLAGNLELAGMIECDESDSAEQRLIAQAWAYLSLVCDVTPQGVSHQLEWMLSRANWLRKAARAAGPLPLSDGTVAALLTSADPTGIGQRFVALVDEPVLRLIVISPYWDTDLAALSFLQDSLLPEQICILLDPASAMFPKDAIGGVAGASLYDRGDFGKGRFIHAKTIIAQTKNADHVLFGSANCTRAALGLDGIAGLNEEACLYRRLPANSLLDALKISEVLTASSLNPRDLPDLRMEENVPLDEMAALNAGGFELRVDTLMWRPSAAYSAPGTKIELLDLNGRLISCAISALPSDGNMRRFRIEEASEQPAFARVVLPDNRSSAPAIITLLDRLQTNIREPPSRKVEQAYRQLDDETDVSLNLLELHRLLESIEQAEEAGKEPLAVKKTKKQEDEQPAQYRKLSYEEFIANRRKRTDSHAADNSLPGSHSSFVRNTLNRIVGLSHESDNGENVDTSPLDPLNMGDETANAEAAMAAGQEFEDLRKKRPSGDPKRDLERQRSAARRATQEQIASAVAEFHERIENCKKAESLSSNDLLRLRMMLMFICTYGFANAASQAHVLPPEGKNDWPHFLGRLVFAIFGGNHPAIRFLHLSDEHDQVPRDIIEDWATCYWCLHACLLAPISAKPRDSISGSIKPLLDRVYRLTMPSREELLGGIVRETMEGMSERYARNLGIDPLALAGAHEAAVKTLFV